MKRVSAGVLKNGFRFYTQLDERAHVSGVGVKVGSIHDPPGLRGMCHLTEHIIGSFSREAELKFEECGCGPEEDVNIRVDRYSTFYGHDQLLQRDHMLELFDIIAGGLRHPTIDQESLERERAAVYNEYFLRGIDVMEDLVDDLVHETMYEQNQARNRIDCEPDELSRIQVSDIQSFFKTYYVPGNMFAVLLGPPFRKAKYIAEKYFGVVAPSPLSAPSHGLSERRPTFSGIKRHEVERSGIHQYHVAIAFPTSPYGGKDDEALDVLAHIWAWRIREVLRNKNSEWGKGTYRALTFTPRSFTHGMIYATFATPSKDFAEFGVEKILAECEKLKSEWVLNDELIAMSNKLYYNYVDAFNNSPARLAEMIIDAAANGDEDMHRLNSFLGRLARVGKKSILRVANEYFTTPHHVQVLIKPYPEQR